MALTEKLQQDLVQRGGWQKWTMTLVKQACKIGVMRVYYDEVEVQRDAVVVHVSLQWRLERENDDLCLASVRPSTGHTRY
jgi:hypothetical protein